MIKNVLRNAKQFPRQQVQATTGQIPKAISGRYLRNGVGTLAYENSVLDHLFLGDGLILMLQFRNGQCWTQLKFAETPLRKHREEKRSFDTNVFSSLYRLVNEGKSFANPANTSVLPMKGSENFLALYEAGLPFVMKKKTLESVGFVDFNWIKQSFSAHPKIDPENGDIYNIGVNFSKTSLTLSHSTKQMKLVKQTTFELRSLQSIHDFCFSGQYIVIFECPIIFSFMNFVFGSTINAMNFNEEWPTIIHIYRRNDFSLVQSIKTQPFYVFHFVNGFTKDNKIYLQYCRYDVQSSKQLFLYLQHYPQILKGSGKKYEINSFLEEMTINLEDFSLQCENTNGDGDFPLCDESLIGKQWRYTYLPLYNKKDFVINKVAKYDRVQKKWLQRREFEGKQVNEPAIIKTEEKMYLLVVVNEDDKAFVEIWDQETFETICRIDLPEFVPLGFHGKWDFQQ